MKMDLSRAFAEKMIRELSSRGIRAEIWHDAGKSVYLRMDDARLGSIRISDHEGREKYEYRWNMRADIDEPMISRLDGRTQYFFPIHDITSAANEIRKFKDSLVGPATNYSYTREDKIRDTSLITQNKKQR